jgi:hypothetical protein
MRNLQYPGPVCFAYVTSLRVEGKQTHTLCKPNTLTTYELRQRATKYCRWEIMFIVWTVYVYLPANPPTPLIPLPVTSNGRETRIFAPTTVHDGHRIKHVPLKKSIVQQQKKKLFFFCLISYVCRIE